MKALDAAILWIGRLYEDIWIALAAYKAARGRTEPRFIDRAAYVGLVLVVACARTDEQRPQAARGLS